MKKFALYSGAALMSAALLFSCSKESEVIDNNEPFESEKTITLTIKASQANTRTHLDGSEVKWDATGETLAVFEDNGTAVAKSTSKEGVTEDNGATMTFKAQLTETTGSSFTYYAFYPASAWYNKSTNKTPTSIAINTPATQTPTATSFDPTADLLIAKSIDNGSTQATSLSMRFARAVAVGKMTIKNLPTNEHIEKVTISAKNGGQDVILAGRTSFNLETAEPTDEYGNNVPEKTIVLDYSALELTADSQTGMTALFTCYPFELGSDDSFTVEVKTETKTYTRTITLSGSQTLAFIAGEASSFSVNMQNATSSENAVDLCYAYLTADEWHAAGGTSSYGIVTVAKTHGDTWNTYASYNSSAIQIRNNSSTNDSYIQLPEFKNNISQVVVTIASATNLTLENTATDKDGSIASATISEGTTEYTFDLSESNVNTAYLRANGSPAKITKIEVYAGQDTRPGTQAAPTTVTAVVDASTTNTIIVSWTASTGATGYEVTLTPDEGDPITKTVDATTTTTSFAGLEFSTEYTPSVVALGDLYLVKANSASVAGDAVTTGNPTKGQSIDSPYSVTEAIEAINALDDGATSEEDVYVQGIISSLSQFNSNYKSITYYISLDGSTNSELEVYSGKGENGADFNSLADLALGDQVIVKGKLQKYVSGGVVTPEIYRSSVIASITKVPRYSVTLQTPENGTISAPTTSVAAGGTVTLTATPNSGYEFDSWTVKDADDKEVTVTDNQFTMPAINVTVSASFKEMSGYSVTYTQKYSDSGHTVTVNGNAPDGSSCSWTTTYTNSNQLTADKKMTYTISGFDGKKITGLYLNLKTNASKGKGTVSMKHGNTEFGSFTIPVIGSTYVLKEALVTATTIQNNEIVTIEVSASVNSVYCEYITITYE